MARTELFTRLPEIWQRLDQVENVVDQMGVLERYLSVWDDVLDASQVSAEGVLDTRDINTIPDRYLRLIGDLVGHRWKDYRSYQWNRQRIRVSVSKYSYKGTYLSISDLVFEHGGSWLKVLDHASLVGVYDRRATSTQNSHYFDPDYFHPGVFQLWIPDNIDLEHFLEDFEYLKPAGTKWIIRLCIAECHTAIDVLDYGYPISLYGATHDYTYKIFNQEFGFYDHIPQVAWEPVVYTTYWSYIHDSFPNVYGQSSYNYIPQYPVDVVSYATVWIPIDNGQYNILGESFYNFVPQLPTQPTLIICNDYLAVGNAFLDMGSLTFRWDDPELTFEDDILSVELNNKQPLVDPIIME